MRFLSAKSDPVVHEIHDSALSTQKLLHAYHAHPKMTEILLMGH